MDSFIISGIVSYRCCLANIATNAHRLKRANKAAEISSLRHSIKQSLPHIGQRKAMSSTQSQSPVVNNEVEITPGTWEAIMEERRIANPSRLMFPYIPVKKIPYPLRRWY